MGSKDVKCPMCGTINYNLNLDETGGWMECSKCKSVTCSMQEFRKRSVKVPILNLKWMKEEPISLEVQT